MSNKKILNLKKNYFYLNLIIINVKLLKINIKFINYFYNKLIINLILKFILNMENNENYTSISKFE